MMQREHIFNHRSKTHWFNGAGIAVSAAMLVLPGLEGSISPQAFPWILAGFAAANHILRNVTTTPITSR